MRATCAGLGAIPRDGVASVAIEPRVDHRASSLLSVHDGTRALRRRSHDPSQRPSVVRHESDGAGSRSCSAKRASKLPHRAKM